MSGKPKNKKNALIDQNINPAPQKRGSNKPTPKKAEYHDDYEQIQAAVLETKRGRWFLGEFSRKNQQVESQLVLDALASLEAKISDQPSKPPVLEAKIEPVAKPITPPTDFKTEQQASHFNQLFANFKQITFNGLAWAGVKAALDFSKIQTIIKFAVMQSSSNFKMQEAKLDKIIEALKQQNVDAKTISQLASVSSELSKLKTLQNNLNLQLESGFKFLSESEKIAHNISPNLANIEPQTPKTVQKVAEKQLKKPENEPKTAKKQPKKPIIEPKIAENIPKNLPIGPAGRIKKLFKIEQTLNQQQAENLVEPAKAFDEAFAEERLEVKADERKVSTAENIEKDIQLSDKELSKLEQQNQKLADLGSKMNNDPEETTDVSEPEIIIEKEFNALNSLALLSQTERTMLFTLQH